VRFIARPEALDAELTDRMERSRAVLRQAAEEEDFPMEESIQRNAAAYPSGVFRYGRCELSTQHLHRRLDEDLAELAARRPGSGDVPATHLSQLDHHSRTSR
jgi:hypothetical protein